MARNLCMTTHAFLIILLICQMCSGEGRKIRSPSGKGINHISNPSHAGIRKLSSHFHKSEQNEKLPKKNTPPKTSAEFPLTETHKKIFPSLKHTPSTPRSSRKANSFWVNKVDNSDQSNCLGVKCSNDFKPTAPGHSPGAGHHPSFLANIDKTSPNQQAKNPKLSNSLAASEDDFRRTTPGRSPGAGHADVTEEYKRNQNLKTAKAETFFPLPSSSPSIFGDSAPVSTNDFRPTAPGSSPGAGHFQTNKIGVQGTRYCLSEKCSKDFQPTNPGDSHSFLADSDSITSEQGKHPGVARLHAEGTDDYRPTKPGHSPGAGHAVLNRGEPNS